MQYLQPYLFFNGTCEEAITFYAKVLGGTISMLARFKDAPMPPPSEDPDGGPKATPEQIKENENRVMHARLDFGGQVLLASDCPSHFKYDGIQGCSITLGFAEVAEGEKAFNALAEGGQVGMPFSETFWSERFGMVVDRFGVSWMVNAGTPKAVP
ncbi:VOC family protein [Rothia nasimurium]|uniref:VOC family protein n=1 Tax=Luteibacter anthropi TaxID=564369 RepID=A0A7X5ZGT9_9GAMM|nr:VOC family protein [Luteibacter anthropi]NII05092.1 VOC family protein [Luteibacter anthropi]